MYKKYKITTILGNLRKVKGIIKRLIIRIKTITITLILILIVKTIRIKRNSIKNPPIT